MVKRKSILSLVCLLALLGGVVLTTPGLAAEEEPQWVEKSPMLEKRSMFGAESVNGKIYVFSSSGFADVMIYNPKTDSWTKGTPKPTESYGYGTAAVNGKIYIIGGFNSPTAVEIYNPETDSWETGASMEVPRRYNCAVAMGGKIYALGGDNASTDVGVYDPTSNTWAVGKPLPVHVNQSAAVALNDKIYLLGGTIAAGSPTPYEEMYIYDLKTDSWEKGPNLPEKSFNHTVNVVDDKIYLIGGNVGGSPVNSVHIFDPDNNTWSEGPNMITERHSHAAAVIDHTIYVMGGTSRNLMEALEIEVSTPQTGQQLSVYLNPTETVQLSVSGTLSDNPNFTWTSSSASVATVDTNGKVTAVAPGLSTITATNAEGISQSIPVRVLPGAADLFRLAVHLTPGQTQQLGMSVDQEEVAWAWQSLDESVATVDAAGKVSAVAPGLAIVQATLGNEVQQIYVRVK